MVDMLRSEDGDQKTEKRTEKVLSSPGISLEREEIEIQGSPAYLVICNIDLVGNPNKDSISLAQRVLSIPYVLGQLLETPSLRGMIRNIPYILDTCKVWMYCVFNQNNELLLLSIDIINPREFWPMTYQWASDIINIVSLDPNRFDKNTLMYNLLNRGFFIHPNETSGPIRFLHRVPLPSPDQPETRPLTAFESVTDVIRERLAGLGFGTIQPGGIDFYLFITQPPAFFLIQYEGKTYAVSPSAEVIFPIEDHLRSGDSSGTTRQSIPIPIYRESKPYWNSLTCGVLLDYYLYLAFEKMIGSQVGNSFMVNGIVVGDTQPPKITAVKFVRVYQYNFFPGHRSVSFKPVEDTEEFSKIFGQGTEVCQLPEDYNCYFLFTNLGHGPNSVDVVSITELLLAFLREKYPDLINTVFFEKIKNLIIKLLTSWYTGGNISLNDILIFYANDTLVIVTDLGVAYIKVKDNTNTETSIKLKLEKLNPEGQLTTTEWEM